MSLLKDIYKKLTGSNKKSSKKSAGKSGGKKSSQSKTKQKKSNTSTKPKTPAKSPSRAVQSYHSNANKKTTSPSQTLWWSYADRIAQNNKAQQEKRDQLKKHQEQQRKEKRQKQLADANKAKRERIAKEKEQKRRESIDKNSRIIAETKKQKDEYYKSKDWRDTKKQIKNSTIANERIALEKQGKSTNEQLEWLQSKKGKKETKKNYKTAKDATKAEINKKIDKAARDSVNKQIKAKNKKQETIDRGDLTYMSRADGAFHTTGEIEANQIQGAKAYADAHKTTAGRVAMGAISAFTPTSYSEETGIARDVYTDKQKKELLKNKEKTSYKVGEFAGNALAFALPGMAGAKKADAVLKGTKTLGGRALNLAKRTGIETAYNTPMNAYQALKGARDDNGDLSLENYGKSLGLNTALDLGMGAGMNAVMGGADKVLGKRYIDLLAKAKSGAATEKDLVNLDKLKNLFAEKSKVASNVTANSEKIQSAIKNTDDVVAKSKTALNADEAKQLIDLKAKESAGQADIGDKIKIAETKSKIEESRVPEKANYKRDANGRADVANEKIAPEDKEYQTSYVKEENVPDKHKAMFEEYKNSTNPKLTQYVKDVYNGVATEKTAHLEKVPQHLSKKVEEITGIDVSGFEHIIGKNDIEHIRNDHSKFSTQNPTDHTMSDVNDIGRIEYVVLNADDVKPALDKNGWQKYASGYFDKNQKPAPQVLFEKQIDGKMYVCESVVDAKNGTIRVTSAYITNVPKSDKKAKPNKIEAPQTSDRSKDSPPITSENGTGYASDNIIQSQKPEVNSVKETPNDEVKPVNDGVKSDDNVNKPDAPKSEVTTKEEVPYRLTADEETYKKASVSTKSLTNMTNEQLEKELSSLEYVKKNKGKTPEHQRLRDERMKAIRGELLARKREGMKKPTREMIASADDLENSANGEFRDDISRLGKETKKATQSFYRLFVDTFSGFEKYASTLPKEMRTEVQSAVNSLRNARNKAGGWVTEGRVLDGKVVGKPLKDIMGDLLKKGNSEKYLAFQDYAFNLHNIDRANSGKEVFGGVSAEESKAIVDELARKYPEFENIQKEINDYFKDLQQYRVETGLASKDTVDYLDALYPNYVPTYRLRESAPANDFAKGNASVDQIYKVAKGGDQKVIPLHEQITNQTEYTLKMGEQNRLFSTIAKMQGFEAKDIDPNVTINDAVQASLIPVRTTDGATYKHKVTFFDNGEPKTVKINQQMYDGILEWRKDKATLVDMFNWKSKPLRGMQRANSLFKNLITGWNPLFGITNIVKDTGEALLYTKNVFGFIKSYPKAVSQILRKGEYFKLYEANGGKYSHLRDVLTTFDTSKFKKWSNPIQWCQSFNDTLEAIPRMAEFISTVDKRTNGDLSKMDSKIANEALMNANEVTLNFGRKGIYGHVMNSTAFPYLNPAIQGVDKLIRVFREAGADGVKGIASLSAKIAAFAVAPALANEIFMEHFGGQAYQDLNSRDKDNFLFIPMGDGKFIKIPKSRVGSALASPAMHFFRYAQYGDDMEWKQMFETAWDNVGVSNPLESSLFSPLALAYMNKTWYGGSIESMSDADLRAVGEAGKIYDSTTSAIAIWIGGKTNISPKKIDYIIDAYTGVIGDIALPYTAEASQGNPLAKKFIMDSVFSNDLSTSFWDKNASMESMSKVKGGKNTDKYNDWKSTYMYDALTLNDAVKAIDADKNLTKAEKAKLKRGIKIQLNNVYRSAVNGEPCDVEPISVISDAIGADKALSMYLPTKKEKSGTDTWGDYYKAYKKSTDYKNLTPKQREANAKKFLNVYSKGVEVQRAIDATDYHDRPDWGTTGVVIAELQKQGRLSNKQANTISESCGVWESSMKAYGKYMKFDGNTKRYVVTQKRLNKMYESMEIDTGTGIWKGSFGKGGVKGGAIAMQLSTSNVEFADRAYYISNYSDENMMLKMNASRGFAKKYGHTTEEVIKMANKADKKGDSNTYLSQGEVRDYCDNMKGNSEEKAMAFVLLGGNPNKNPYGSIGDYSSKRDTGITADEKESSGGRGRRRGGYGHHGGGGGGGKGADDWMAWLEEQGIIGGTTATGGTSVKIKDNTSESALNDAYRKRVRKLMTNK